MSSLDIGWQLLAIERNHCLSPRYPSSSIRPKANPLTAIKISIFCFPRCRERLAISAATSSSLSPPQAPHCHREKLLIVNARSFIFCLSCCRRKLLTATGRSSPSWPPEAPHRGRQKLPIVAARRSPSWPPEALSFASLPTARSSPLPLPEALSHCCQKL